MTADTLRKLEEAYASYALAAESARAKRNEAIRQALAEGWTHAQVADATGLTRGRIGQIAQTEGSTHG